MPPSSQETASAEGQRHQQPCSMWTGPSPGYSPCHPACIGSFHMVSILSLHLFTSCPHWLEHDPLGMRKSRRDSIHGIVCQHIQTSIDGRTSQCMHSMQEVT